MTSSQSQKLGVVCPFFKKKKNLRVQMTELLAQICFWILGFCFVILPVKWFLPEIFLGWYLSNFIDRESTSYFHTWIQQVREKDKNGNFSNLKIEVWFAMFPNEFLKTNWIFWILADIAKKICHHISCVTSPSGGGGINFHWKLSFFQKVMKKYQFWGLPNYLKVMISVYSLMW